MFSTEPAEVDEFLEPDRGGRRLHQPAGRRDDGRLARRAAVRRLEGLRHERQGGRRPVLRAAIPSRAEPNGGGCMTKVGERGPGGRDRAGARHRAPRAEGQGLDRARPAGHEPVDGSGLPARARPRAGLVIEDVDGNRFLDFNAGIAVTSTGHCHPAVVDAISTQAGELIHYCSSDFYPPVYAELSERLVARAPIAGDSRRSSSPTRGRKPSRRRSSSRATRPAGST